MKEKVILKTEKRSTTNSRNSKQLRKAGYIPGSIYGKDIKPISLKVKEEDLRKVLTKYGRNQVFDLDIGGQEKLAMMIKDVHHSPITRQVLHVEFQHVNMTEEIKADIEVMIVGNETIESKRLNLVRQMDTIPVKGLPQNIPDYVEVDVSKLDVGSTIEIKDIQFPEGIVPDIESDKLVLSITAPVINTATDEEETEKETETETAE